MGHFCPKYFYASGIIGFVQDNPGFPLHNELGRWTVDTAHEIILTGSAQEVDKVLGPELTGQ